MLAISNEGEATWRLVNPQTNDVIRTFTGHKGAITSVAFSADGQRVLTGSVDGSIRLWNVQTGETIRTVSNRAPIVTVALSPDGRQGAFTNTRDLRNCHRWDFEASKQNGYGFQRRPLCLAFSADNQAFFIGFERGDKDIDQVMMMWSLVPNGGIRSFRGRPEPVGSIAASPDGKYVASVQGGQSPLLSLWETSNGKLLWQSSLPSGPIHQLVFSPDNAFVLAAGSREVRVWNLATRQNVPGLASSADMLSAGFSLDSKQLLCASLNGDKIHLDTFPLSGATMVAVNPSSPSGSAVAWEKPVDPDGDCKFPNVAGKLTIAVPDKPHILEGPDNRANSPRVLFDVEGDFTAQVRVGGDFVPAKTATRGPYSWIGAGLLVWVKEGTFLRWERAGWHERKPSTLYANWEVRQDGVLKNVGHNFPSLSEEETYLRLRRRGNTILASYSEDGQQWHDVKPLEIEWPAKVKLGVLAGSTSARTFAPVFDQFQFKQGPGEMVRVDLPGSSAVTVVKPPPPPRPRPRRSFNTMEVPNEQTVVEKQKLFQVIYKDDLKSMSSRSLSARLCEENRRQPDPGLRYVMLLKARDLAVESGEVSTAVRAVSELSSQFSVEPLEVKCEALEQVLGKLSGKKEEKEKYRILTQKALLLLDRAVIDEDFVRGERLLKVARAAALKADMSTVLGKAVERASGPFESLRKEYTAIKPSVQKLDQDLDDPEGNLALGRFRSFVRGDWEAGLPLLAKGGDKDMALSELAGKDVDDPAGPTEQADLGDEWAKYADKADAKDKAAARRRAYFWYQRCLDNPKADKKDQARAKKISVP